MINELGLVHTSVEDCRITLDNYLNTETPNAVIDLCNRTLTYMTEFRIKQPSRIKQIQIIKRKAQRLEATQPAEIDCDICGHPNPPRESTCSHCYAPLN